MDPAHERTDSEVVRDTLVHKEAFAILMVRYEERLRRYVRRLGVRNEQDQDDLLQDIFIKAYKNLHGFDQSLSFSSWIYRIAHNEAVSSFRRKNVRPEGNAVIDGDEVVRDIADSDDVMRDIISRHDGTLLTDALLRIDAKYRDIIVLRYFEGKEYEEIADILQMPVGSVATRIYRAKDRLRVLLAPKFSNVLS
jgi:RNA polymerase sigma-70 factor (ECF subfamily)